MNPANLKSPFPYFGGKSRIAAEVWRRFGTVKNFVEPFAGSLAVLLARPDWTPNSVETVNDADCYLANFWRALQHDFDAVAKWADWPVNEVDLLARHQWLMAQDDFLQRMKTDPDYYDVKIAGWWVWGKRIWLGRGWCRDNWQQLPDLGNFTKSIVSEDVKRLAKRLEAVRVTCGDWRRVLSHSATDRFGDTALLLDPPYGDDCEMPYVSAVDTAEVRAYAIEAGKNPLMRVALCGYDTEHDMPDDWERLNWKANGGYGNQADGRGKKNSHRECIWFSPACIRQVRQLDLFAEPEPADDAA